MKEIQNQIKSGNIKRCYLFYGTENFLKKAYEDRLKKAVIDPSFEMMNYLCLEDKAVTVEKIIDFCETMPFFSDRKLLIVRNSGFFKGSKKNEEQSDEKTQSSDVDTLEEYLKNVPETVCIIFSEDEVDKRKKIYKTFTKEGYACEFKTPDEKDIIDWIVKNLKKNKIMISRATASYLIRSAGGELENLSREIEKLESYKNENEEVTVKDIDDICTKSLETKIFDLVGAIGKRKPDTAITIYKNLIMMKEYPGMILYMVVRQFRLILQCMVLSNTGEDMRSIATMVGIRDFVVKECLSQSKNFTVNGLKRALEECIEIDTSIKTGLIDAETAVETLILKYSI